MLRMELRLDLCILLAPRVWSNSVPRVCDLLLSILFDFNTDVYMHLCRGGAVEYFLCARFLLGLVNIITTNNIYP